MTLITFVADEFAPNKAAVLARSFDRIEDDPSDPPTFEKDDRQPTEGRATGDRHRKTRPGGQA
jgi:hypothetical protein